jgi:hypothetical protein
MSKTTEKNIIKIVSSQSGHSRLANVILALKKDK